MTVNNPLYEVPPVADSADNVRTRDVIGNKEDVANRTVDEASLVGLAREICSQAEIIESHHHNYARAIGAKVTPTGTRFAESIGVLGLVPADAFFTLEPGNVNVWGSWLQIWGTDDAAAILPSGRQGFWDIHKMRLYDSVTNNKNYIVQLAASTTAAADALTAGTYAEFGLYFEKVTGQPAPFNILTNRESAATSMWARLMTTDGTDASDLLVQFEVHGYPAVAI